MGNLVIAIIAIAFAAILSLAGINYLGNTSDLAHTEQVNNTTQIESLVADYNNLRQNVGHRPTVTDYQSVYPGNSASNAYAYSVNGSNSTVAVNSKMDNVSGQWVYLPGCNSGAQDCFYMQLQGVSTTTYQALRNSAMQELVTPTASRLQLSTVQADDPNALTNPRGWPATPPAKFYVTLRMGTPGTNQQVTGGTSYYYTANTANAYTVVPGCGQTTATLNTKAWTCTQNPGGGSVQQSYCTPPPSSITTTDMSACVTYSIVPGAAGVCANGYETPAWSCQSSNGKTMYNSSNYAAYQASGGILYCGSYTQVALACGTTPTAPQTQTYYVIGNENYSCAPACGPSTATASSWTCTQEPSGTSANYTSGSSSPCGTPAAITCTDFSQCQAQNPVYGINCITNNPSTPGYPSCGIGYEPLISWQCGPNANAIVPGATCPPPTPQYSTTCAGATDPAQPCNPATSLGCYNLSACTYTWNTPSYTCATACGTSVLLADSPVVCQREDGLGQGGGTPGGNSIVPNYLCSDYATANNLTFPQPEIKNGCNDYSLCPSGTTYGPCTAGTAPYTCTQTLTGCADGNSNDCHGTLECTGGSCPYTFTGVGEICAVNGCGAGGTFIPTCEITAITYPNSNPTPIGPIVVDQNYCTGYRGVACADYSQCQAVNVYYNGCNAAACSSGTETLQSSGQYGWDCLDGQGNVVSQSNCQTSAECWAAELASGTNTCPLVVTVPNPSPIPPAQGAPNTYPAQALNCTNTNGCAYSYSSASYSCSVTCGIGQSTLNSNWICLYNGSTTNADGSAVTQADCLAAAANGQTSAAPPSTNNSTCTSYAGCYIQGVYGCCSNGSASLAGWSCWSPDSNPAQPVPDSYCEPPNSTASSGVSTLPSTQSCSNSGGTSCGTDLTYSPININYGQCPTVNCGESAIAPVLNTWVCEEYNTTKGTCSHHGSSYDCNCPSGGTGTCQAGVSSCNCLTDDGQAGFSSSNPYDPTNPTDVTENQSYCTAPPGETCNPDQGSCYTYTGSNAVYSACSCQTGQTTGTQSLVSWSCNQSSGNGNPNQIAFSNYCGCDPSAPCPTGSSCSYTGCTPSNINIALTQSCTCSGSQ